jgi:hypothetical protein
MMLLLWPQRIHHGMTTENKKKGERRFLPWMQTGTKAVDAWGVLPKTTAE